MVCPDASSLIPTSNYPKGSSPTTTLHYSLGTSPATGSVYYKAASPVAAKYYLMDPSPDSPLEIQDRYVLQFLFQKKSKIYFILIEIKIFIFYFLVEIWILHVQQWQHLSTRILMNKI